MTSLEILDSDSFPFSAIASEGLRRHDVIILPESMDGDIGVYRGEVTDIPKRLRVDGVDADFAHAEDNRHWRELFGPTTADIVVALTASFLASGGWDTFKSTVLPYLDSPSRKMRLAIYVLRKDGTSIYARMKGHGQDVIEALSQLRELADDPDSE